MKYIKTAELRDIIDSHYRDEISYSKMAELLNIIVKNKCNSQESKQHQRLVQSFRIYFNYDIVSIKEFNNPFDDDTQNNITKDCNNIADIAIKLFNKRAI